MLLIHELLCCLVEVSIYVVYVSSFVPILTSRQEGYELHMCFRTTLGDGLVAIGQGNTHFSLQLRGGRLNLHSNLISKFEGIRLGEALVSFL